MERRRCREREREVARRPLERAGRCGNVQAAACTVVVRRRSGAGRFRLGSAPAVGPGAGVDRSSCRCHLAQPGAHVARGQKPEGHDRCENATRHALMPFVCPQEPARTRRLGDPSPAGQNGTAPRSTTSCQSGLSGSARHARLLSAWSLPDPSGSGRRKWGRGGSDGFLEQLSHLLGQLSCRGQVTEGVVAQVP